MNVLFVLYYTSLQVCIRILTKYKGKIYCTYIYIKMVISRASNTCKDIFRKICSSVDKSKDVIVKAKKVRINNFLSVNVI